MNYVVREVIIDEIMNAGPKECNLTVVTSPSNATCVLTYDGTNYTTKTLTVLEGSTVSYNCSYTSDYTTASGSWLITEDTTKNVTVSHKTLIIGLVVTNIYDSQSMTAEIVLKTSNGTIIASKTGSGTVISINVDTGSRNIGESIYCYFTMTHPTKGTKTDTRSYNTYGYHVFYWQLTSDGKWSLRSISSS